MTYDAHNFTVRLGPPTDDAPKLIDLRLEHRPLPADFRGPAHTTLVRVTGRGIDSGALYLTSWQDAAAIYSEAPDATLYGTAYRLRIDLRRRPGEGFTFASASANRPDWIDATAAASRATAAIGRAIIAWLTSCSDGAAVLAQGADASRRDRLTRIDRELVELESKAQALRIEREEIWLQVRAARPLASRDCPDGLTPDGDECPRCGAERGASGADGGSWVHLRRVPA